MGWGRGEERRGVGGWPPSEHYAPVFERKNASLMNFNLFFLFLTGGRKKGVRLVCRVHRDDWMLVLWSLSQCDAEGDLWGTAERKE